MQIPIDAPLTFWLDQLELSLYLQVLVPPVPLSSSTAVTTHTFPTKKIAISAPSLADKLAVDHTNLRNA